MTPNENPTPASTPSSETQSPEPSQSRKEYEAALLQMALRWTVKSSSPESREAHKAAVLAEAIKNHPRRLRSFAIVKANDERTRLFNESLLRNPGAAAAIGLKS